MSHNNFNELETPEESKEIKKLKDDITRLKYLIVILFSFLTLEFMIILWLL